MCLNFVKKLPLALVDGERGEKQTGSGSIETRENNSRPHSGGVLVFLESVWESLGRGLIGLFCYSSGGCASLVAQPSSRGVAESCTEIVAYIQNP